MANISGFNEKALHSLVNKALDEKARALEADLNRSNTLRSSQDQDQTAREVQRIAQSHGLDLSLQSAGGIADQLRSVGTVTVRVEHLH